MNALESLLIDRDTVDRDRLVSAIKGRVGIDSKTGAIVLDEGFIGLNSEQRLLAVLLAQLAAVLLERAESEALSVAEIVAVTGMPRGTVAPALRRLVTERRLLAQDASKRYLVPRSKVIAATEVFNG